MQPLSPVSNVNPTTQESKKRNREDGTLSGRVVEQPCKTIKITSEKIVDSFQKTALTDFSEVFADETGTISYTSVYTKLRAMNMGMVEAIAYAAIVPIACGILLGAPTIHVKDVHDFVGFSNFSFFKQDGNVDEDKLNKALSYAQSGKDFLSDLDIQRIVSDIKFQSQAATITSFFISKKGLSWTLLIRFCTDHWEEIDGVYVPCLTKATIIQYVKDTKRLFKRVEDGELPKIEPKKQPVVNT